MRWWQCRLAAAGALLAAGPRSPAPLRFAPGGQFKLALFADLHYGENAWTDWGPAQDAASDHVMAAVLDAEKPGAYYIIRWPPHPLPLQADPSHSFLPNHRIVRRLRGVPRRPRDGEQRAGRQREPVLGPGGLPVQVPFEWLPEWFSPAGVPPVHCPPAAPAMPDPGCSFRGTPRVELMTAELSRGGGLSRSSVGPGELWPGVSNYMLQVLSRERPEDPALLMYFLDSGGGSPEVVSCAQVTWFLSQSRFLNPDGRIPELVFWHIPSTAYVKVAPKAKSEVRKPCVGSLNEEDVAPQVAEWGMMNALAHRPSVKAIFVGHNHGLDCCCPYEKLWLCFARHTGHGGYGAWPRGARIVDISEKKHFSVNSWIRMENGSTHSHVTLSSARFS